jgi:membrane-associated phospholipid phosphatase
MVHRVGMVRTGWLTTVVVAVNTALVSRWTVRVLRLGTIVALVGLRRWRHLVVFLGCVVTVELAAAQLALLVARPRPIGVRVIGGWEGFSFPGPPVAALAVTLVGMVYALLPSGRPRSRGKWAVGGVLFVLGVARLYLAVEHPTDLLAAVILGVAVPVVAFRFFTPTRSSRSPTGAPRPRTWTSVAAAGRPSAPPSRSSWA